MIEISKYEAYQAMSEMDFKVYDHEVSLMENLSKENGAVMEMQFFVKEDGAILLRFFDTDDSAKIYHEVLFDAKAKMTEQGKKAIGRPSLGVTKKISVTLPEEIWDWLDQEAEGNRSSFIRELILNTMGSDKKIM